VDFRSWVMKEKLKALGLARQKTDESRGGDTVMHSRQSAIQKEKRGHEAQMLDFFSENWRHRKVTRQHSV